MQFIFLLHDKHSIGMGCNFNAAFQAIKAGNTIYVSGQVGDQQISQGQKRALRLFKNGNTSCNWRFVTYLFRCDISLLHAC
jgi:hypothetical protein